MTPRSRLQLDGFAVWCGPLFIVLMGLGWIGLGGFFPFHRPAASPEEIHSFFASNHSWIAAGMILMMASVAFFAIFTSCLCKYISQIEGGAGVLTIMIALGAAFTIIVTYLSCLLWITAGFRIDRSPELVQLLNDISWINIVGGFLPGVSFSLGVALSCFLDSRASPLFPRWFGWVNIWVILLFLPDQLLFFFHTGPFAWDGLFAIYLPLQAGGVQMILLIYFLRRAVLRSRQELTPRKT